MLIFLNQMVYKSMCVDILNQMVKELSPALDRVFHALAHPARRSMLRSLAQGEKNLTELAAPLRMSFPAASKHVRVLERAKLVRRRHVGRTHLCHIEGTPLGQATEWLETFQRFWDSNFQRLDELLEDLKSSENLKTEAEAPQNISGERR